MKILILSFILLGCGRVLVDTELAATSLEETKKIIELDTEVQDSQSSQDLSATSLKSADLIAPLVGGQWIKVPGNIVLGVKPFYVMAYEARALQVESNEVNLSGKNINLKTHLPYSSKEGLPWRFINELEAFERCRAIGPKFSLISNAEWMTIAHNLSKQSLNWTGNEVGKGCPFRGNSREYPYITKDRPYVDCGYSTKWERPWRF